ncbi:beta-ketoacyl synthase chain length factor [Actinophytocola sp.]|uniref:beta-ketoacyl synthase chain length factor n=1 Tax=Actinophytocola sp. TaxID=1872138 RepID=UPI003D6BC51B
MTLSVDSGVVVLARAAWPESDVDIRPPELPMFVRSSFSPLVAEVAARCLRRHHGAPPVDPETGERTAVVVLSVAGDVVTSAEMVAAVDQGERLAPMLFFQSVPNTAVGHVAATWGLAGPVVCLSPPGDPAAGPPAFEDTALDYATELISDGDADRVLVLVIEQGEATGDEDRAAAMLVTGPGLEDQ